MVFCWRPSDSKYPQVSRTLLSILASLDITVVSMVSARPPISNSSSPITKPVGTVPSAPITIGISVTIMFHSSFSSLARSKYSSLFSFSLILWSVETVKSTIQLNLSFFFFLQSLGLVFQLWVNSRADWVLQPW